MDTETSMNNNANGSSLGLSALTVSAGTLLSRIFGLIRDMAIAFVFGASRVTDVFFVAYLIPSLFRKLLAEGALSSSIVPVYVDVRDENNSQSANALASAAFTATFIGVGAITVLGIIFSEYLVMAIAPGFIGSKYFALTVQLTRLMFPFLLTMSMAAVVMGVLHAHKIYAPSAFAPACLNICLILCIVWLAPRLGLKPETQIWALVVGVLIGGFFQFFVQWLSLQSYGVHLGWNTDWQIPGLSRILTMMGPMIFGLAITQMIAFVDKMIASFLNPGNISHLYYSNRLFQFPFALIGIALGTVVLPESAEHVTREDLQKVVETARESIGFMSFLMIPSAAGLALIGFPLIGVLFRNNQFRAIDQQITFSVLFCALFGLVAYGLIRIFVSICYSFEDTKGPMYAAGIALIVNAILDVGLVLVWPNDRYRVCGLAIAGAVAVWIQVIALRQRLNQHLIDESIVPWSDMIRHLFLTVVMVSFVGVIVQLSIGSLSKVLLATSAGASIYLGLAYLMGESYPRQLFEDVLHFS